MSVVEEREWKSMCCHASTTFVDDGDGTWVEICRRCRNTISWTY